MEDRMTEQPFPSEVSPSGRRVLVAVVTGAAGERIQAWRQRYDPEQARRLPPHATLCYWAPVVEPEVLERQVRHAFDRPVSVRLGGVHEFDNDDRTFYVKVEDTDALDAARVRLYDGTHLELPGRDSWTWHVTCVRYGIRGNLDELRRAASELTLDMPWQVDTVACLELRGDRYEPVAEWHVGA
jgi:hypothetical protein